ncbi:putative receptor-like protein kinase [Cinnamomum micranthum f. kanehirae]|uniref:Putative receptor-like protein kinase n=1 Tax=Cinnamomum micranthum f. kanehirae TaxID=337451 RepID=A0A3S3MIS5_9MAGN|nr:putative receptor-like protein kinase [Cinnamomum micranthum f. kanehirae]
MTEYGIGNEVSTFGDIYRYGILLLEIFTGTKPTDEIFNESLSLHQFAKLALPERVMEIVDQNLLSAEVKALNESQTHTNAKRKFEKCLISTITVGVACSVISMKDRMDIEDAIVEMQRIRDLYLGVGINDTND